MKTPQNSLDDLTFQSKSLSITSQGVDSNDFRQESGASDLASAQPVLEGYDSLVATAGGQWRMVLDRVTGRPSLIEGEGIPWIPGAGNDLRFSSLGLPIPAPAENDVPLGYMEKLALDFLQRYPGLFGVSSEDLTLMPGASGPALDYLYFIDFQWTFHGIPVENAHVVFRVNNGNLVQFGEERICDSIERLDPLPSISKETAWEILWGYVGGTQADDEVLAPGRLLVVPVLTSSASSGDLIPPGTGMEYRLVYVLDFRRPGVMGTWEARVDAHTGEILSFLDRNEYGSVTGGIYPTSNLDTEVVRPLGFINVTNGTPKTCDAGGNYAYSSGTATASLTGKYVKVVDSCGSSSLSTSTAPGDLAFGTSTGTDCTTPGFGGAGNTHAARTTYYHLTLWKEKAMAWLPSNGWLKGQLTDKVNLNKVCNAYWDGSAVNFFKSGSGCSNTGELPTVFLHEVGHGLDDNDGSPSSTVGSSESYADINALLMTHESCIGVNFVPGVQCGGYGNPCTACTGIRDADYANHTYSTTPAVPTQLSGTTGFHCSKDSSYPGPCGYEGHCESYIMSEVGWDLAARDLPSAGFDAATSWFIADRLFFLSRPTSGDAYSCPTLATANGCGTSNWYETYLAVDDDNGNLSDGTPHAAAIYAAFNRHAVACSTGNPTSYSACPSIGQTTLSAVPTDTSVALSWTSVTNAVSYEVYRNESSADAGYAKIASVTALATTYTDTAVQNGIAYFYRVLALGSTSACFGSISAPVSATPTPCTPPGAPAITSITDNDACAQSGIQVNYTAGSGATSHNLLKDGSVVVTGYTSGATYNPGDTSSHTYVVQAVNSTCTTNSTGSAFTDANGAPATPAAPTVSDVSPCAQTGVSISWSAVSGATGYDLQVDGGTVVTGVTSPYTYSPGNGNVHNYAIRTKTATCTGSWSAPTAGTDANNTPGAPAITGIADVNVCAQSGIQVSYTPGSGAASHSLLRDGAVVVTNYASGATYNPGDGTSHTYVVRAVNGTCTTDSAGSAFSDAGSLGAPTITSITDNDACAQSGIKVNYTAGSGATSHNLLMDGSVVVTGYPSGTTYNPGNTASHTYVVQAVSGSCTADSAGSSLADANNTPGAPVITSITDADACSQSGIKVSYTAGSGATSHSLVRDGSVVVAGYTSGATYNPGDLASHTYVVRAVNSTCFTDSVGTSFADGNATPAAPASAGASASAYNSVSVTWTTVTGATGYNVYRATGACPQVSYAKITASPVAGPPYTDNTVSGSTTYAYVVTAVVGACESVQSPCAQATTPAAPCTTPPTFAGASSVTPVSGATCSLQVAWSAATSNCGGAVTYNVYRNAGSAPVPPAGLVQSGLTGTTYTDASVTSGTTYYYIVQALDSANGTSDGNTIAKSGAPGVATTVTLYSNDFESGAGLSDWSAIVFSGNSADWRGIQQCTAHSGNQIFRYGGTTCTSNYSNANDAGAIPNGANGGLSVPAGAALVRLSFWHRWNYNNYDGGNLWIALGTSNTYTYVPASAILAGSYNGSASGYGSWTGQQNTFVQTTVDLDAACNAITGHTGGAAGQIVKVAFDSYTDWWWKDYGWFLDDVTVTYDIPGSCTSCAAPSSLANNSAADVSACAASGVQVSWSADPGNWGDGGGTRTYDVLRDGAPVQTGIAYGTTSVTTIPPDGLSHTYAVRYNNACGLSATTAGAAASDANNPPVPTITGSSSNTCPASSVTLTTESGMTGYQWYLAGSPITGATSNTYAAAQTGSYTVSYTNGSGCSGTSAPFPVTVAVCEVSPAADSAHALKVLKNGSNADIQFQDMGTAGYNVYVSTSPDTHAFAVASSTAGKKECDVTTTAATGGMRQLTGYSVESGITGGATVYYILVTADNGATTEGPMGNDSTGTARTADSYCNH